MKLPTSNKTASFGRKHYVKKGYYPAKLLAVKPFADKEGNLIPGKHGNQLIFEFGIYGKDENDVATVPLRFTEEGKDTVDMVIPKFVYHQYKDKNNAGEFQTAITPKSAITKTLVALGWTFSEDDVDIDALIGNMAELNINDYPTKDDAGDYIASTIGEVSAYNPSKTEGNETSPDKPETPSESTVEKNGVGEDKATLEGQLETLKNLHESGNISEEGYKTSAEQIKAKLEALK